MPRPILQFDLRKLEWCPKCLQDVVDQVGYAFESPVPLSDLEIIGTNHLERIRIWTDEGLESWLQSEKPAQLRGREEDKVLQVTVPQRVLPTSFKPGEAPILAVGTLTGSFDGDGRADARVVDFQLRIFDCGHFYMKQSLSSSQSQSTPYWMIFEGRWRRSVRGYRLEFFFRYPRTTSRNFEFVIQDLFGSNASSLNFSGDQEIHLKGFLPTIIGNEPSCWAALKRRPEKSHALANRQKRFGGEDEDEDEEDEEEDEEEDALNQAQKQELVQSLMQELKPEQQQELRHALGKHGMSPELYSDLSPPLRQALQRLQRRAQIAARRRHYAADGESTWPMYLGLALFVFVFVIFAYLWYDEHYGRDKPVDDDEDDYWKTDEFF